jgi:urea transport system substrate-binding protein
MSEHIRSAKRPILVLLMIGVIVASIIGAGIITRTSQRPIKVGILHSVSGTMAISESPVVEATLLAIEEINQRGGVLGRPIQPIRVDGRSDWNFSAAEAERLILTEGVDVVFGCWTSACRKTVKPVFERFNHLLIYPVQYEGMEISPAIVYTGASPNQQIIPAVKWGLDNLGKRFFLVGSDYVFPHAAHEIIKDQVVALNGEIVGERYIALGSTDVDAVVKQIVEARPDVILNTINGDSNLAFFRALRKAGITSDKIPTISFSLSENEIAQSTISDVVGDYSAWNYFQSLPGAANEAFVRNFRARYGANRVTSDPLEAAYFGVYLWAQAVTEVGTSDVKQIRETILGQSFNAPNGIVYVDPATRHTWKTVRIGKILPTGQFQVVWSSETPIRPAPYPLYRTKTEWSLFLENLNKSWNGQWANPNS